MFLDTVNYYLTHWNSATKKSDNPFMVLCTNATICEMIFEQSDTSLQRKERTVARSLGFKTRNVPFNKAFTKRQTSRRSMLMFFFSHVCRGWLFY
jgi:hypothetical protein